LRSNRKPNISGRFAIDGSFCPKSSILATGLDAGRPMPFDLLEPETGLVRKNKPADLMRVFLIGVPLTSEVGIGM
jgi:hypothetical protein